MQAPPRRLTDRLKHYAIIALWTAVALFFVLSSAAGIYGLFTHQSSDYFNKTPWGWIALPGYFVWMPLPFLAAYGLA